MDEPGLAVPVQSVGDPLVSEVTLTFESFILPTAEALANEQELREGFAKEFGPAVKLALDDPEVRFSLVPGGSIIVGGQRVTIQRVSQKGDWINANVRGTSDAARQVVQTVVKVLDRVGSVNREWDYYEKHVVRTSFGTATTVRLPGTLRDMLAPAVDGLFSDVVEERLASRMVPRRTHGMAKPAFARVLVHGIECQVLVAEESGTSNKYKLEFHHMSSEDLAAGTCYVISELDYDGHMELVDHLLATFSASDDLPGS